ncbi:MAG TPA: hypothetical protein VH054_09345 [Polyangiaceae bacterium]|jgi:hypothetical protein|nr:hypothetical protein [Polyangiaceae bacterium]
MKRSSLLLTLVVAGTVLGCRPSGPRALVLVEAAAHPEIVQARAKSFEARSHREVRLVHVPKVEEAMRIAARGDADVALVPEGTALGEFDKRNDGESRGTIDAGGEKLLVIEINAAAHPTVDAEGAKALAAMLVAAP